MNQAIASVLTAVTADIGGVNLWGALGCAVAFSASLFAVLDAFGDYAEARATSGNAWLHTSHRLRFGSKIAAAGVTSVAAGVVLALDNNWWALIALVLVFAIVIGWSAVAVLRGGAKQG